MSTTKLLLAEIRYRKLNFVLSLLAVTIAVALFVAGPVLVDGYGRETRQELAGLQERVAASKRSLTESEQAATAELAELEDQTRRVMRDLGFNLFIVHKQNDLIQYLSTGLPTVDMPQEWVEKLAHDPALTMVTHLVATLQGEITWQDPATGREHQVRLAAYMPETTQSHARHKTPMGYDVQPGEVFLGYRLGEGKKVGDTIEVRGREFRVARILPEQGTKEDTTITMHLSDGQAVLEKPEKINQILALECRCAESALPAIRAQVYRVLPDTVVTRDAARAVARSRQRALVSQKHELIIQRHREEVAEQERTLKATEERRENIQESMATLATVITALVVLSSALWVGLLALGNVRDRRTEIGVFRALGKSSVRIATLLLGKAVLLGLAGAALGFVLGTVVGYGMGTDAVLALGVRPLYDAVDHFAFPADMLLYSLVGASLLSVLASYLPTLVALRQDPAAVLREF